VTVCAHEVRVPWDLSNGSIGSDDLTAPTTGHQPELPRS
jgi:hypothetical protein